MGRIYCRAPQLNRKWGEGARVWWERNDWGVRSDWDVKDMRNEQSLIMLLIIESSSFTENSIASVSRITTVKLRWLRTPRENTLIFCLIQLWNENDIHVSENSVGLEMSQLKADWQTTRRANTQWQKLEEGKKKNGVCVALNTWNWCLLLFPLLLLLLLLALSSSPSLTAICLFVNQFIIISQSKMRENWTIESPKNQCELYTTKRISSNMRRGQMMWGQNKIKSTYIHCSMSINFWRFFLFLFFYKFSSSLACLFFFFATHSEWGIIMMNIVSNLFLFIRCVKRMPVNTLNYFTCTCVPAMVKDWPRRSVRLWCSNRSAYVRVNEQGRELSDVMWFHYFNSYIYSVTSATNVWRSKSLHLACHVH